MSNRTDEPSACVPADAFTLDPLIVQDQHVVACFFYSESGARRCVAIDPATARVSAAQRLPEVEPALYRLTGPFEAQVDDDGGKIAICRTGTKACSSFDPHYSEARRDHQKITAAVDAGGARVFVLSVEWRHNDPEPRMTVGELFDRKTAKRRKRVKLTGIVQNTTPYWTLLGFVGDNVLLYNTQSSAPGRYLLVDPSTGKAIDVLSEGFGGDLHQLGERDLVVVEGKTVSRIDGAMKRVTLFEAPGPVDDDGNLEGRRLTVVGGTGLLVHIDPPGFVVFDPVKRQIHPPQSLVCGAR